MTEPSAEARERATQVMVVWRDGKHELLETLIARALDEGRKRPYCVSEDGFVSECQDLIARLSQAEQERADLSKAVRGLVKATTEDFYMCAYGTCVQCDRLHVALRDPALQAFRQ